jgi:hypothetical protein
MANIYKVAVGIFVAFVVIALAVYLWVRRGADRPDAPETPMITTPTPVPSPTPSLAEQLSARLSGVTLATSDAAVRELVDGVSSHPQLTKWLVSEDLVRRFVASVDSIAEGRSPRQQLEFMQPTTPFRMLDRRGTLYMNPSSYHRYDLAAEVFESLDTAGTVALYREMRPLIAEAYREISPTGSDFDNRLLQAIDHLLAVEVPEGDVELEERTVTTFAFADERLESLSDAQRHLLRMGPKNVRKVQSKLREIRDALLLSL